MVDDLHQGRRLGRGLAALIGDSASEDINKQRSYGAHKISVECLRPNPQNPRTNFEEAELEELTASIKERGILQPIIVRQIQDTVDIYEIIAGERRWRAAQRAGLLEVPVLIVQADDKQSLEFAIIENIQRSDLNALEEALGYERLIDKFCYTQTDLAKVVGKSRSHVANALRLLNLPQSVQDKLHSGLISAGHARALLALPNPEQIVDDIIKKGLNVRDIERMSQKSFEKKTEAFSNRTKDADTKALEKALFDVVGLPVSIDHSLTGGQLSITYKTLEQLDSLCRRLQY